MFNTTLLRTATMALWLLRALVLTVAIPLAHDAVADQRALSPAAVWEQVDNGAVLIDVRTNGEVSEGTFKNTLLIPHDEIATRKSELPQAPDKAILVFCASGIRSARAVRSLQALGYTNVFNAGSFDDLLAHRAAAKCIPQSGC